MKTLQILKNKERGQGFMELAISMIFLIMLLSVTVDLGWAFYTLISLRDTAQEAASFGSICTDTAKVRQRFHQSASSPLDMALVSGLDVCYRSRGPATGCIAGNQIERGDSIIITVTYEHEIVTPLIGAIINRQTYPLQVVVSGTVLQNDQRYACK